MQGFGKKSLNTVQQDDWGSALMIVFFFWNAMGINASTLRCAVRISECMVKEIFRY